MSAEDWEPADDDPASPSSSAPGFQHATLDALAALVNGSLLRQDAHSDGEDEFSLRFAMLETIREYGLEQLTASGEADALRRRHASYFLKLAEEARSDLEGADPRPWLDRLEIEHDNLRGALGWAKREDAGLALRLGVALRPFWHLRGHLSEGRAWLEGALARSEGLPATNRAAGLAAAGTFAWAQGDYPRAEALYEQSECLWRKIGDAAKHADVLRRLADVAADRGDYARATMLYEDALAMFRGVDDGAGIVTTLLNLGTVVASLGDYERATTSLEEVLTRRAAIGPARTAATLINLGVIAQSMDDTARASARYEEALALGRELGSPRLVATTLANLGFLVAEQGNLDRARSLLTEALALSHAAGDKASLPEVIEGLAMVAALGGWAERAARLFGAAKALREEIDRPRVPTDRARYERSVTAAQADLSAATFAWGAGRALSLEEAVAEAMAPLPDPRSHELRGNGANGPSVG